MRSRVITTELGVRKRNKKREGERERDADEEEGRKRREYQSRNEAGERVSE